MVHNVSNSRFVNSSAKSGGAIGNVTNCTFINSSSDSGGAIYIAYGWQDTHVVNCSFVNSSASNSGGAINFGSYYGPNTL
ncbi:hypothetical protein [Methanobrevibacter oralis]|uniref:hypothetical protein n=1 Tax=Methanobrevibacter oralis TaxID=66851 RepID=UPI001C73661E|nr:hypothetical protein [Methanobrevibacter oralis]